ncbi:MAG: nucleotide disphospho-sugar-binding domain-containing protein [Casimicrobiaceae bacterium]
MARILLAWELGGDYGHLMRFLTLARELTRRGHEPLFALRELTHVDSVLHDEPFSVFQAPVWVAKISGLPQPIGFAETLMRLGFLHPPALTGLCRGWRTLISTLAPKLLVFDYAPTALLATRGLGLSRVLFGASFSVPPCTEPMPTYRSWRAEPVARVLEAERLVLAGANAALKRLGEPPMGRLADLLDTDDSIIATSEEFDQYPGRTGARYWGDVANLDKGVPPLWPVAGSKRIFAYLKPHFRDLVKVLAALRAIDASVVIHAPGLSVKYTNAHTATNIAFSPEPLRMQDVCRECDLAICHSGASTVESVVTSGKPVLLLPQHLEQMMTAKRVQELGAGLVVDFEKPPPDYQRLLRHLLDEPSFTKAAQTVAQRHTNNDPADRVVRIADRCEELMALAATN